MPIKLVPPRPGKTPYYAGRGTHFGVYVDRSTKARERGTARKIIRQWERDIERGVFARPGEPTFASAALAYMQAGGERRFMAPLLEHFKTTILRLIDQQATDAAALTLYPAASPATRNRQVHTPVSAVMKHAGVPLKLRRPAGAQGNQATGWLWPEQMFALLETAGKLDKEFRLLLIVFAWCGPRLSEALALMCDDVRLTEAFAYLRASKNGESQAMHLPPSVVAELANHPRGLERPGDRVFRFAKGGHVYSLFKAAAFKAGITLPPRQAFHILRHTYATWLRRYGQADERALLATDRWKDRKSVQRYTHVIVTEEARRADLLPTPAAQDARHRRR